MTRSPMPSRPRIYLAGPEVFLPDPIAAGKRKAALCAAAGLEGVYPLDNALPLDGLAKVEQARLISESNEALMRSCDAAIANLTPFRGVSADSGTAFEVGFMRALGKPVLAYANTTLTLHARSLVYRAGPRLPFDFDAPGVAIEDFDLTENLMIDIAVRASGVEVVRSAVEPGTERTDLRGFELCLAAARRLFRIGA